MVTGEAIAQGAVVKAIAIRGTAKGDRSTRKDKHVTGVDIFPALA